MTTYIVGWEIEVDADNPREAAEKAREIQLDPNSTATVFAVTTYPHWNSWVNIDVAKPVTKEGN